jgi:hypothetical protein
VFLAHRNHWGVEDETDNWNTQKPCEKLVKYIKRATIVRQGIAQQCPERVETLHQYKG